jgi:hypothetical protein
MQLPRARWAPPLGGLILCAGLALALVQSPARSLMGFNEREVKSERSALDKADVWALDFRFKDPRLIKVHIPGHGTRIYWYLWYQVVNRTGKPRHFYPLFELVTHDNPAVYLDEYKPSVLQAIRKIEDRTGYQKIKDSVAMSSDPIPPSKGPDEAYPIAVTGVAVWEASAADPAKRDPKDRGLGDTSSFSIFVNGLSNGSVEVDSPLKDGKTVTHRKTLQLNFRRRGDRFSIDSRDIEFVPPAKWIYRAASPTMPSIKLAPQNAEPAAAKKDAPAKDNEK